MVIKPCLKWVGGKTQIIKTVIDNFPKEIKNYHEPFLGGGSVLLALLQNEEIKISGNIYASDLNFNLISFYKNVQNHASELVKEIKLITQDFDKCGNGILNKRVSSKEESMISKETYYYWIRSQFNKNEKGTLKSSAMFIFINKTCFRGLYREGPNGFNVPYGNYKSLFIDETHIINVSKLIKDVNFSTLSFEESMKKINKGDFIYLDPPYAPETEKSFVGYNSSGFDINCHNSLFNMCKNIADDGNLFLMSNSDVKFVRDFFDKYKILTISCKRSINSKNPSSRTNELLITNQ